MAPSLSAMLVSNSSRLWHLVYASKLSSIYLIFVDKNMHWSMNPWSRVVEDDNRVMVDSSFKVLLAFYECDRCP